MVNGSDLARFGDPLAVRVGCARNSPCSRYLTALLNLASIREVVTATKGVRRWRVEGSHCNYDIFTEFIAAAGVNDFE